MSPKKVWWDFSGGPVVKILSFQFKGIRFDPWLGNYGQNKEEKKNPRGYVDILNLGTYECDLVFCLFLIER